MTDDPNKPHDSEQTGETPQGAAGGPPPLPASARESAEMPMTTRPSRNPDRPSIDMSTMEMATPEDAAQESLANALQVSMLLLKAVLVVLVVLYAFSGTVGVGEREAVVRMRFGKVVAEHGPGFHLGLPAPFDSVVRVETGTRDLRLQDEFYFFRDERMQAMSMDQLRGTVTSLDPDQDGSLITGDSGLVHARARLQYRISDPSLFVRNVGLAEVGVRDEMGQLVSDPMSRADALVRQMMSEAMIRMAAQLPSDTFVQFDISDLRAEALAQMQAELDAVGPAESPDSPRGSGIALVEGSFVLEDRTVPPPVIDSYEAVAQNASIAKQLRSQAQQEETTALNQAAGEASAALLELLAAYELASAEMEGDQENPELREAADAALNELVRAIQRGEVQTDEGVVPIGGRVARLIGEASSRKTDMETAIFRDVEQVLRLGPAFDRNPELVTRLQVMNHLRPLLAASEDDPRYASVFYLPVGTVMQFVINQDPDEEIAYDEQRMRDLQQQIQDDAANPNRATTSGVRRN